MAGKDQILTSPDLLKLKRQVFKRLSLIIRQHTKLFKFPN